MNKPAILFGLTPPQGAGDSADPHSPLTAVAVAPGRRGFPAR